jgi:hypothetical protein
MFPTLYHIRSLRHIHSLIDNDTAVTSACSIVATRLDYCNSVLNSITNTNIRKLQRVQNKLARVVCNAPHQSSASCSLRKLHWLPTSQRIGYKIASITYRASPNQKPQYILKLLTNRQPVRSLRSSNSDLLVAISC